jgi:glutamate carboxypeptidase
MKFCQLSFLILLLLPRWLAAAETFDAQERAMIAWIDANQDEAVSLLRETVNIGSGTMNLEGVRAVGRVMREQLDALGLKTQWVSFPHEMQRAGHLVGRNAGDGGTRFLLIGHLDTVFEADDGFQAFSREGNIGRGPGIDDMKSGNVVIITALKALQHVGLLNSLPVVVYYTGDEEKTGQPLSLARGGLIKAGKWADIALGFESAATRDGKDYATVARRSSSSWLLEVEGRQAHSSQIFSDEVGAGAIFEAARILDAFYQQVKGEEYLTFNAGNIQGGTQVSYEPAQNRGSTFGKTNVVPRKVVVHGGLRTISAEQLARTKLAMQKVVAAHLPHTQAKISFSDSYPPMSPTEGNERLQKVLSAINEQLGRGPMAPYDPARRGAADISFVAPYTDALAGMGAIGKGGHTPEESLELDSLALAAKRAAILIYRLSRE